MAGSASNYLENKLIDHSLGTTTYTKPSAVYVALYTASPSDTGGGTEVTGGSYVRKVVTFSAASSGSAASNTSVNFTSMPACTVVAIGILDSLTSGNLLYWGTLSSSRVVASGDTVSITSGNLTVTLD
jgi:hypothetical protein